MTPGTNIYLTCCLPLFHRSQAFITTVQNIEACGSDFRDVIVAEFVELERIAFAAACDPEKLNHAKYAMAAFIDEIVMYSSWPHRLAWMGRPLQLQFFGEHLAGEHFFNRLSQLRQGGQVQTDLLEVYYLCLQLGFRGRYRLHGEEQLLALQVGLRSQIEIARGVLDSRLAPVGLPRSNIVRSVSRDIPIWVIGVVTITVIFFIYFFYTLAIDAQLKQTLVQFQQDISHE